jgi:hypothetical protein
MLELLVLIGLVIIGSTLSGISDTLDEINDKLPE